VLGTLRFGGLSASFIQKKHHSLAAATARERQLKRWTRAKKEALIAGNRDRLKQFSRCRRV
jgi:predicted GIY-YIG superfamily endonuclease